VDFCRRTARLKLIALIPLIAIRGVEVEIEEEVHQGVVDGPVAARAGEDPIEPAVAGLPAKRGRSQETKKPPKG